MYLEIEIDHNRGSNKKYVTLKLDEDTDRVKMKFDRRPEFDIPDFRILRKNRLRAQKKSDGSASFLRAARAGNLEKVLEFLKTNTDINTCNANGLNALHLASKEGHVHVVTELLQRGASVDAATKKGNTALHIASLAGQEEIVKVLVQHQALVNIQSQNGFTPLYMAAQENHDNVVRFLLANNANQSLATEDGFTPLAVALQQGHDKVVAVLLENDTRGKVRLPALHIAAKKDDTKAAALLLHTDHNPDVTSKSGFTPLHIAAHYGNENIANLLIQRGADVNYIAKHQITPLHVASKWGKGNMVSLLIDKGANYEAKTRDGLTPLHCAARSGHETVVDMLLEKGAPITSKTKNGLAPLHMASQGDHVDAARILLYHKAPVDDVTVDYLTALHVAAHCGHVRVAKLLLDRKADPNSRALNGFTPLHIACKKNRIKVVELLLKHGASIEATTESGLTPLHVASFMGCMNIVIYLIQHGASADVPTVRGETPLHLAARANQTDIIRILLRNGAQVDARAREQQTALHIASRLGNSDIVVLLLQHGAAVDATTKDHYTALHIAAKEGQEEVASVLLEHGASLTSTTKKGFTPLHLAAKYGNMKVARLLLQKDAPVDAQGKNGVTPLHVAAHYDHQNVALLLLDKGASPHATAKNGYTPLHIAARKNQMDIATTLLEYGASANAESKAGFTPLHLSSQEGHTDMATLLIEHNASPGACAKNGLTPLHLCAQEDRVNVAAILVKHGAQIDPMTKAGYTPLHVASHFGQMNMVRFLLQHGAKVDSTTQLGYTPLHQAAQQGHTQIVNLLLENKAEPNAKTKDGKTALSIAQRLGYISVVETLKIVTETTITTTTTTVTEEKYKVVVPETMHETFMSESEDEGGDDNLVSSMFGKPQHVTLPYYEGQLRYTSDDTMLGDQSYRYLTVDEMKSLGDDSLPIDVTKDEKMDVSFINNSMAAPPVAPADQLSPQHQKEQQYAQFTGTYPSDNVDIAKTPILAGVSLNSLASCLSAGTNTSGMWRDRFLVSFMVDARGGAMRGCRHSGVRVIIPPRKAAMPMRITCRYLKKDKLVHAPPLMEGEALASRILEMGPAGAKFLGPVIIEVPHFASLRGKEREIVILRSDNGETWREHTLEATEEAVQEVLNESFDGEELKQLEDLNTNRITRILTTDFPQYFAIVTRIRQEVHAIGPEGGMVSSTVVPQVQAVFPQGALTKKIKVGLQAQPIPTDLVAKLLGNRVAVSPIVTVEPRRRKFHKPITLTIPVPQAASKGMINQYSGEAPTLRLLCSITGGTTRAQWEDVTGSTPLTFVNDCVSFTTTVSARFWLMDCSNIPEATKMATELYREAIHVPFMAKFVVFSKRHQLEEARVRVFCMTDDREDKTLENQEMFVEVAKSRDVEVLEGKPQFLEFAGNLVPVTKSGDQLAFNFYAFRENRLPFTVRVKDQHADCIGRVAFMRQPKVGRGDPPQTPICNLNIALPDNIQPEPAPSEPDLLALEKKYSFLSISKADTIHKADLRLTDISNMLGTDWVGLARELEISDSDINIIKSQYPDNAPQQAIVMLRLWMQTSGNKESSKQANGNTLEKGLRKIGRDDIVNQCIFNVELVTDDIERAMAKAHLDQSGFEAFREELGPSRDATLNRDISLDVSYDEQDMMKEAESAEEEEENQRTYQDKTSREQRAADMSPTYESEEKKYAGEEKIVAEDKVTKDKKDESTVIATTVVEEPDLETKKETVFAEAKIEVIEEKTPAAAVTKVQEKKAEKVEEKVIEEQVEEKPIIDIEKHVEVVDKAKEPKKRLEEKAPEAPVSSEIPEDQKSTITKVIEGPDGTTTTTTTTERRSFITDDDGAVQEHIVIEKRTTSVVDGVTTEEDKSDILQKLGEELGRLDEKLEEKFKEKRKTEEPEEGFTQTSVEKSQMSSARGTADVSTAGTTVTTVQQVGDTVVKAGQALIQQMSPHPVDRRIAQQDALTHAKRQEQQRGVSTKAATREDESKNGRTEERGCSPITVLEGRAAEGDAEAIRPLSRSGAHTIKTTTSWGAPVSATTSIQLDDSKSDNCVQLTLHSESHVTLHAPGEIWQELKMVQQQEQQQLQREVCDVDLTGSTIAAQAELSYVPESKSNIKALTSPRETCTTITEAVTPLRKTQESDIQDSNKISFDKQIPSKVDSRDISEATAIHAEDSILSEEKDNDNQRQVSGERASAIKSSVPSAEEAEIVSVDEAPQLYSNIDDLTTHDLVDESIRDTLSTEREEIQVIQSSLVEESKVVCDNSVVLSEDYVQVASESLAPSAHRPTTLMITSNSNESTDDAECITNDPSRDIGENDKSQDLPRETNTEGIVLTLPEQSTGTVPTAVGSDPPHGEGGAIPRPERPSRPAPRTTTLVKVKVEKRPVGSHSQVRERSTHEHHVPHVPSVEEEVRGLMQEVKEATSQIKQEVKELRQADTPTPDTPTPLREFREFLNREEEQEQERLPTIKEMCRESEDDASLNAGGEGLRGIEHLRLDLSSPVLEHNTPVQFVHHAYDESRHPDSGYSTLEGYYAVGTDPSVTTRYIPSYNEPVPEGSSSEPSIKSELESPSSFVDSSDFSPVDSVCSATSPGNEKQGRSKFKSFMKKVRQLTSKGQYKLDNRGDDSQGEEPPDIKGFREVSSCEGCIEGNWEISVPEKLNDKKQLSSSVRSNIEGKQESDFGFKQPSESRFIFGDADEASVLSVVSKSRADVYEVAQNKQKLTYPTPDIDINVDSNIPSEFDKAVPLFTERTESSSDAVNQSPMPIILKSELYDDEKYGIECASADNLKQVAESPGSEPLAIGFPLPESPFSESSATGSQYAESFLTEPSTGDHSPEGIVAFEMDSEHNNLEVESSDLDFKNKRGTLFERSTSIFKPEYCEGTEREPLLNINTTFPKDPLPEGERLLRVSSPVFREKEDDFDLSHKETGKLLETLIEEDETEDCADLHHERTAESDILYKFISPTEGDADTFVSKVGQLDYAIEPVPITDIERLSKSQIGRSPQDEVRKYFELNAETPEHLDVLGKSSVLKDQDKIETKDKVLATFVDGRAQQNLEIGTETFNQIFVSEDMEEMLEAKELPLLVPKYGMVKTLIHQSEYPQKMNIGHEIVGTVFSRKKIHQGIQNKAETINFDLPDTNFIQITKMATHVSEMEYKEEVGLLSEMHLLDADTREIQSTIHLDHERETWTSVTVQEKPLLPKHEVMKVVQKEKIAGKEMNIGDDITLSEVKPEICQQTIHQGNSLADFEAVTICKENIYLPHTIENAVQSQEYQVGVEETEEIFVPEYIVENASVSVCRSEDPTDLSLVSVKETKVCYPYDTERAVQIQETVENSYMSSEFCSPNISTENALTCVHKDLEPQGVAIISEPTVFDWHNTTRNVQLQEIEEETDECKDMSFPYIDAEEPFVTVHEKIPSKDLGIATSSHTTVCHHLDLKVGHVKTEMEEEGMTKEIVPLDTPGDCCQITTHQDQHVKEFNVVDVKDMLLQSYSSLGAAQQQWILEKTDVTENISIPQIHEENAVLNMHQDLTSEDLDTAVVSKKKVCHPYETERRAHNQVTMEEIEHTENLPLPEIKLESVSSTIHMESIDFGSAVVQKDIIGHPYETECVSQPRVTIEETERAEDVTFSHDIEMETAAASEHHEFKKLGSVLVEEVKISHPCGTERAAQPQVTTEEMEKMEDLPLPDIQLAYAMAIDHQEPKETGTAVLQKLKTLHLYETERVVQPQMTTEEMEQVKGLSLPDAQLENVVATDVQETGDFAFAQIGKVKVNHPLEIENAVLPQLCLENVCKTEDISVPCRTFEEGLTSVQQSRDLLDFNNVMVSKDRIIHQPNVHTISEDQNEMIKAEEISCHVSPSEEVCPTIHDDKMPDFNFAIVSKDKLVYPYELQRPEAAMIPSVNESFVSIHKNVEVKDFGRLIVSEHNVSQHQREDPEKMLKELPNDYDAKAGDEDEGAGISSVPKYLDECMSEEITILPVERSVNEKHSNLIVLPESLSGRDFEQKDYVKNTRELLGKHESDTHTADPANMGKIIPPLLESVNVNVDIGAENTAVPEDRSPIDNDMKLEYYKAEHELAKIIHKQMEDLIRDEEPEREKEASRKESNPIFPDTGSLECCEDPNIESVTVNPDDLEKIYVLDRVSDELRNMISNLEYNLAVGISKNIRITPILARLEQLEQEVANITKSSEATESSIPVISNTNETDSVVSYPQSAPLSVKGAEASSGEKRNSEDTTHFTKMPVVLGKETANLHPHGGVSPAGETNGVDVPEALTDVEDLLSDGDQSPLLQRKGILLVPQKDMGAITDTEDMDLSGEEDEFIQEKKNLPTIQDLGLLPEPTREVVNLTEGFARQPSPLLSGSESEVDDVEGRHKKNITKMEVHITPQTNTGELQIPEENDAEGLTDVEDMVASGDEVEEAAEAVEDSLPDHYMDQGEGISNKESVRAVAPTPKIFVPHHEDSSDEEQSKKQKLRRRSKGSLKVEIKEDGTTDVEDLVLSDKGGDVLETGKDARAKMESKDKPKKKKLVRRKIVKKPVITKTLVTPDGEDGVTDVEILTGDDEEVYEDDELILNVPEQEGAITDSEDVEVSDTDDVEALIANPVQKLEPAVIPAPHAEKVKISETEEQAQEESGADTDEEGFVIEDKDDEKPLIPRKRVSYEPLDTVEREALEVEEQCEPCLTDMEDFDMDDKDEDEIIKDVASRIPEEGEIYSLKEMEGSMGSVSKTEMIKDIHAELKQQIKDAELAGLTLQEALNSETLTDVEDLEETEKPRKPKRKQKREDETDEESVDESDIEEEIPKPPKETKRRGKGRRLPLAPQISEVRFVETEQGPLSIIITPDILENKPEKIIKDQVSNVVFLENEEKETATDVEDLALSDGEEERRTALKAPQSAQDPVTDTEEIDIDPAELDRPHSPLPPNVRQQVFSSPKRELIYIKEDAHGVPQVTIRKLGQDELVVSDVEDTAVTDTEDIEVSEGEALRIVGVTEGETSDFELPDSDTVEVSTKLMNREILQVEPEEDGGSTDVEELPMTKKHRRKPKSQSKLTPNIQEDSHTDVEILSDQEDKSNLRVRTESPNAHTDLEDFETSEAEELEVPTHDNAQTPDIITNSAIRKVVILKEGPDGIIQTEDSEVAPARKDLLKAEDDHEGITDVEDMEASGAEDEDPVPEYPAVDLPSYESSNIIISEKTSLPQSNNEAKHIKDNLLLPEDNYNNLTDVESLSEGEGNRCASNTSLLSSQQLTYAVESCTVAELSYYLPPTDPKLCVHPGVSLESDPFCGELTSPLVVEAELEQVYYHAPREDAHEGEVELEASNGCVVRKRQVVASLCQAREIRRFWSLDRNSPLNQSEIYAFATPTIHKKGFKTILYLEQPNLLDTISISDTLCDSGYFRNERLRDFDSSSIDSFDDHYSYRDSDIVTVVDQFNQESSSSFDELPSPHLSSISSTGIVDSLYSGRSFGSDPQCYDSHQSSLPGSSFSRCSSEDLRKESELTLSLSGISVPSYSTDNSLYQEMELSFLDDNDGSKSKDFNESPSMCHVDKGEIPAVKEAHSFVYPSDPAEINRSDGNTYMLDKANEQNNETDNFGSTDKLSAVVAHLVTETVRGPAVEQHKGFTTECIREYASERSDALAIECTERGNLETHGSLITDCIKAFAAECVENPIIESTEDLIPDYGEIDATLCIKNSPTGYIQRSITEWIVGQSTGNFGDCKNQVASVQKEPTKTCSQFSVIEHIDKPVSKCSSDPTRESICQPTLLWLKSTAKSVPSNVGSQASPLLQSGEYPQKPFEDSGVHDYQTSGSFTASFDKTERLNRGGYESDQVSLADSVLGLEDQLDKHLLYDVEDSAITYISAQFSPTSQVSSLQFQEENYSKEEFTDSTRSPASVVPLTCCHTLPQVFNQSKTEDKSSHKSSDNIAKDFQEISKDFGGVKGLIDQWEVIVREEQLKSLPSSPAVGRKILPVPSDASKKPLELLEGEVRVLAEVDSENRTIKTNLEQKKNEDADSSDGGVNVIEEVASVCDIIQQFEGRVGRLGKMNAHRQRLRRGSQSPASRSPSHHRRVATVKPLCEPQLQQENSLPLQEGQIQQQQQHHPHQEQLQELLEHTASAGFVPRVVESLSIAKCSNEIWEENPTPQASVSNPEGTHEAAQIAEQQPTTLAHDQGLDVEEMSNIMESYTSDGSDLITTTTHTTTSIDPDPITSTQITRITRRTEIEDGEVKEEVFEEY